MQLDNIRDVLGEDVVAKIFESRHLNQKLLVDVPDGVYDHITKQGVGWRMIYIDKFMTHIISSDWISSGGPSDLPDVISSVPFGTYPDHIQ